MNAATGLFPDLLGEQWGLLADPVRQMHGNAERVLARGMADVEGARHLPARWLRRLLGLPEPGPQQALEVVIERDGNREVWTRRFAHGRMRSVLFASADGERLHERLGPLTFVFDLRRDETAIDWQLRGGRLFGLPLPRACFGRVRSRSATAAGRYTFDIDARVPLLGQLVAYRGWLDVVDG